MTGLQKSSRGGFILISRRWGQRRRNAHESGEQDRRSGGRQEVDDFINFQMKSQLIGISHTASGHALA